MIAAVLVSSYAIIALAFLVIFAVAMARGAEDCRAPIPWWGWGIPVLLAACWPLSCAVIVALMLLDSI